MKPQPFCCDMRIGTTDELVAFIPLFKKASGHHDIISDCFWGFDIYNRYWWLSDEKLALTLFTRILPVSEGIKILNEVVMESTSPSLSVVKSRIIDAVNKSLKYTDGQISGIEMNQLEERVDGILNSLQPKP